MQKIEELAGRLRGGFVMLDRIVLIVVNRVIARFNARIVAARIACCWPFKFMKVSPVLKGAAGDSPDLCQLKLWRRLVHHHADDPSRTPNVPLD